MRCYCCDVELTDYESTLRSTNTGMYLDMCNKCVKETGLKVTSRADLVEETNEEEYITGEYHD